MKALVVGGTGPTGPHVVEGLGARGFEVTIFHRGTHELEELPPVEHIHGDPHFPETIAAAVARRDFDVVVASYGRIRHLADALAGRCRQFIAIGGVAAYRGSMDASQSHPYGMPILADEDAPTLDAPGATAGRGPASFGALIRQAELHVMALHDRGAFSATYLRFPALYGPRQVAPSEWSVVRRVLDGRRRMILPDGGLVAYSRMAARNAAHAVLLAVDRSAAAAGRIYNCADREVLTLRQWMERIAGLMGATMETISLPWDLATSAHGIALTRSHVIIDSTRIRDELGYTDITSFDEAMAETIEWYRGHPVTAGEYPWLTDRFDYAAEDMLIAAYERQMASLAGIRGNAADFVHPYAHPESAGLERDHRHR